MNPRLNHGNCSRTSSPPSAAVSSSRMPPRKTSSLRKTSPKSNRRSRGPLPSSLRKRSCRAAAEIEAKNFAVTRESAARSRQAGPDGRRCSGGSMAAWRWTKSPRRWSRIASPSRPASPSASARTPASARCRSIWYGTAAQKAKVSAEAGDRRMDRRLCALGILFRLRCDEYPRPGAAFARRPALHPERREDVDLQRRFRRSVHRLRQDRWRASSPRF